MTPQSFTPCYRPTQFAVVIEGSPLTAQDASENTSEVVIRTELETRPVLSMYVPTERRCDLAF